jgi:hypothetical protein
VPVAKGEKFKAAGRSSAERLFFIPGQSKAFLRTPDWQAKVSKSWNSSFTADDNGWIWCECYWGNGSAGYLTITGQQLVVCRHDTHQMGTTLFVPVAKGDTCQASGGRSSHEMYYIPAPD